MDEVAEPAPHAPFPAVEPAARFPEIGHGGQLAVDGPRGVPAAVERVAGLLRRIFVLEARVHVADEILYGTARVSFVVSLVTLQYVWAEGLRTIIVVVTHHHLLRLAILAHLAPKILVERIEVVLQLAWVHLVFGVVGRVLVQVWQEDGLGIGGFYVLATAAVAVPAGADFVVEGAVHFVLLRAEDGCEVAVGLVSSRLDGKGEGAGAYLAMIEVR